jgi:hypothetical protein
MSDNYGANFSHSCSSTARVADEKSVTLQRPLNSPCHSGCVLQKVFGHNQRRALLVQFVSHVKHYFFSQRSFIAQL